ncbi:hypothetical protein Tco_0173743 [Tanacetum coccineum]
MSSSNHPTSNIEDAFSINLPEYIPVVPDYFPASPGKTYSSASNDSTEIYKLQRKQLGQRNKIAFAHYRISNLEHVIEEIRARQQINQEDLQDVIYKLTINKEGPSDN